ncbi:hypothetical protein [Paludisphaera mucosa]|uniref:Uncharacterized protein n=1 Tax=Paludisphaera mucosa TaxID=3030827 RepID=A0ABT6FGQ1_9BACT|nr:hypothetical protein [Paludisphaera mucosa]MDG3006722.1 hypothetical protein [Paludisphaera mucosa]
MSPELETLDQLLGGELPLVVVRGFFDEGERFEKAMAAMLCVGEIRLLIEGGEIPHRRWAELLAAARDQKCPAGVWIDITDAGIQRIGG